MLKSYVIFLLPFLLLIGASDGEKYVFQTKYYDMPLDHFSFTKNTTFKLRYLVNDTWVKDDRSPILFYTGNEGNIELFAQNTGFMWEHAPELGAMLVFAEHRYYGLSLPFGNQSYNSTEHLGYLSSEQALADFAELLYHINPKGGKIIARPVIALGGSYGGMLSAWIRIKYPHLVQGAIAASAPVRQFANITPCDTFSRILTSVFTTAYNKECPVNIKKSWSILKNMSTTAEGLKQLNTKFKFCTNLTKAENITTFIDYLTDVYGNLAMANYPYNNSFLAPLPAYPVREFCWRMDKNLNGTDLIDALQSAISVYTNYTGTKKCLDIESAYDSSLGSKGWDYQACTEMVMPMCSTGDKDMFLPQAWDLKKYSDDCFKKFGARPRENMALTNYGGWNFEGASNIVFSNGLMDPWSGGGVLRNSNDKIKIILIPEGAHHIDLRASDKNDPGSVIGARNLHIKYINQWINDYWKRVNSSF